MMTIGFILLFFLIAIIISEAAVGGRKVHFAAATLVVVHGALCAIATVFATRDGTVSPVPVLFFWGGALLTWIGIRSHIENSILLRMLYFLRTSPNMTRSALSEAYDSHHGTELRLRELEDSGFINRTDSQVKLLAKAQRAKKIHGIITMFWR
jgi:hypothetical protein